MANESRKLFIPKVIAITTLGISLLVNSVVVNPASASEYVPLICLSLKSAKLQQPIPPLSEYADLEVVLGLQDRCMDGTLVDYQNMYLTMRVPGYSEYNGTTWRILYAPDIKGRTSSVFNFKFKSGQVIYPSITVDDMRGNTKDFTLPPIEFPDWSYAKKYQTCTYVDGLKNQCNPFPKYAYKICSKLGEGEYQEKIGGKWTNQGPVFTDSQSDLSPRDRTCKTTQPYLAEWTSGLRSLTDPGLFRIQWFGTPSVKGFFQYITIKTTKVRK